MGEGWSEIVPTETDYTLVTDGQYDGQNLTLHSTDFRRRVELGYIGGLNCPIAIDDSAKVAYRASPGEPNDEATPSAQPSHRILAFDLVSGEGRTITTLPQGMMCTWLLSFLPDKAQLIAQYSRFNEMTEYLARIDVETGQITAKELPESAFFPTSVDINNERILYSGRGGGAVLVDFEAELVAEVGESEFTHLEGGGFLAGSSEIVIGGHGIHLWDPACDRLRTILPSGNFPVPDCRGNVWFNPSDGSLAFYELASGQVHEVVSLAGLDTHDTHYSQPVVFSPDDRMGIAQLTGKQALSPEALAEREQQCLAIGQEMRDWDRYEYTHCYCVVDTEQKTVWKEVGFAHNVSWVSGQFCEALARKG